LAKNKLKIQTKNDLGINRSKPELNVIETWSIWRHS